MDRSKFKEALKGLTSDQRTAFLFLENQIKVLSATTLKNHRAESLYKEINDQKQLNKNIMDELEAIKNTANLLDVGQLRQDLVESFSKYTKDMSKFVDESFKVLEARYNQIIDFDNQVVNKLIKDRSDQQNALVDAGILPENKRTRIATLRDIKKGIIELSE